MKGVNLEIATFITSLTAFCVSLIALLFSHRQLQEARSTNGGRGMNMKLRPVQQQDLEPDDAAEIDAVVNSYEHNYVAVMLTFEALGPAKFYQVIPYTWGTDGRSEKADESKPIACMDYQSGEVKAVILIQQELLEGIRIGVAWIQPDAEGFKTGAIRATVDGALEEWKWRNRLTSKLPGVSPGRWCERKQRPPSVGPLTQPHEVRSRKSMFPRSSKSFEP